MSTIARHIALLLVLMLISAPAHGQSSATESWPAVKANFDLLPKTRLQVYGELENGEESPFYQWKIGATLSYRAKRIFRPHRVDIDDENEYILNLGVGYEYIHTIQSDKTKSENRSYIQATPATCPGRVSLFRIGTGLNSAGSMVSIRSDIVTS